MSRPPEHTTPRPALSPVVKLHRDGPTWLIYAQLSLYAYFLYAFAPTVTLLRDEEHVRDAVAGLHGTLYAVGVVVVGLFGTRILDRIGRGRSLWISLGALCVGIAVYASVPVLAVTLLGALLSGAAASGVTITVAAALLDRHGRAGPAAVTEANALAAGTGLVGPLLVGTSVSLGFGWRPAVLLIIILIGLLFLLRRRFADRPSIDRRSAARGPAPAPLQPADASVNAPPADPTDAPPSPTVAQRPLGRQYWLGWTVMVLTVAIEFSMTLWSAQLLRDRSGAGAGLAATGVTAIVAGMCLGRALGSPLARRFRVDSLLFGAFALTAAGFALFWTATVPVVAFLGLAITGLGMALHYPLSLSRAIGAAPHQADRASAMAALGTGIAIGVAPFLLGLLSDVITVRYAFLLVPTFLVLASSALVAARTARGPRPTPAAPVADSEQVTASVST